MSYSFLDAASSVRTADSSFISGSVQRPAVDVASVLTILPVTLTNSSLISVSSGSVISVWQSPSIVGTYVEDSAHTTGDKGVFVLAVRNDTLSSVTSADGDYSPIVVGPVGEQIVANAPLTKWIQGQTSIMYGTSVQAIAPQGASIFTYITALQIANTSPNNVYVTFTGGLGGATSTLGFTTAPANGGSNIYYPNGLKTGANSGFSASISGVASIFLSAQGFTAKI